MTTDNFCFYLPNRLIQTSQAGGQRYSDTSHFSIPWFNLRSTQVINQCEVVLSTCYFINKPKNIFYKGSVFTTLFS